MRERVHLFGDPAARPEGLERVLMRAGFSLDEGEDGRAALPPDLALVAVPDAGPGLERALVRFQGPEWAEVPVLVLLGRAGPDGIARALALGAADALAAPVNPVELGARLEARLRVRAELQRAAGAGSLHSELFLAVEELASAQRPEEVLEKLVRRVGSALGVSHCACLNPSPDRRHARLVAVHEQPTLRDVAVDLFHYPEAVEAAVSGRTVHAPEVLRDGLFLAHLAQWPDSPEVHEIASAAAVPLIAGRSVRAVLVLRTRRGEPPLTPARVAMVEQLVHAAAALLDREERRSGQARRPSPAAVTDPLTGCANLDALDGRLREELERVRRYGSGLAFALVEVARPGKALGDQPLAECAQLLQREIRSPDFVARYSGGEFAVVMPATSVEGARRLLARMALRVDSHAFGSLPGAERPRLAAGLVGFPHPSVSGTEDLLAAAERALEQGRAGSGGDRVGLAA